VNDAGSRLPQNGHNRFRCEMSISGGAQNEFSFVSTGGRSSKSSEYRVLGSMNDDLFVSGLDRDNLERNSGISTVGGSTNAGSVFADDAGVDVGTELSISSSSSENWVSL